MEDEMLVPDLVLVNGKVVTIDANGSISEAVSVRNSEIMTVGSSAQIMELVGAHTDVINLEGKTVLPGFIESHCQRCLV